MSQPDLALVLAEERRIMNEWAPDYDRWVTSNSYVYESFRRGFATWLRETLVENGRDLPGLALLDLGCGPGSLLRNLPEPKPRHLVGFDLSEGMLREARRVPGAAFVQGAIEVPPFAPSSFDVVTAAWTLHHLLEPAALFRLAARVLRPGGWLFVLDFDRAFAPSRGGRPGLFPTGGRLLRSLWGRKNRRALARLPAPAQQFNPAHEIRSFAEIERAMEGTGLRAVRRQVAGVLLPRLSDVLLEESPIDRALARLLTSIDVRLAPKTGGAVQWIAARRSESNASANPTN